MLDATVAVVTYNHAPYIADCLRSLLALDPLPSALVVVDNGSRDGTAAIVKRDFPAVKLIEAGANLGFAGGCNLAVRSTESELIVLANPDLVVRPDWLAALCQPLQTRPGVGVTGGKLLYRDGVRIQHAGGMLLLPLALGTHRGVGQEDRGQFDAMEPVEYVTGAALACRRSLWEALDGLDQQFFPAYYEEVDFCTRARQAGHTVLYTPRAVGTHVEGASVGHGSSRYLRLFHLNRLRYLFKHFTNTWLMREWLPAELGHLRAVADTVEVDALECVYLAYQSAFCYNESQPVVSDLDTFPDATATGGETELQWVARQAAAKATLRPEPIRSRWPALAWLRNKLAGLATTEYLRPIIQQQTDANLAMAEAVAALVRQRRAAEAAALLQGMLLAKIWGAQK
ncbi:MAG TPA: glycosyltransferase family 2 protein [Herpetosiphonaceae bacterium]